MSLIRVLAGDSEVVSTVSAVSTQKGIPWKKFGLDHGVGHFVLMTASGKQ
jgi:hypothetical protein